MKQTSTPASTSVRMRADAPFIGASSFLSVEDDAGVEDAGRVERRLDAAHELELGGVLHRGQVRLLGGADAVLARHRRSAERRGGKECVSTCRYRWAQ